jgi:hypothetical protein
LGGNPRTRPGDQTIRTTGEHPFYVEGQGWTPANALQPGDRIHNLAGEPVTVEDITSANEWETVYNLRVADWHTYFVGDTNWGWAVWAHNAYFYHGRSEEAADSIITSGARLTSSKPRQDFGKAFYTTTDENQARKWANQNFPGHAAVLKFYVSDGDLSALNILAFPGVTLEWKETVWAGSRGIRDDNPLDADMVTGPFLTNPGAMKESATSAFDAKGKGDQEAWLTKAALTVLQRTKPVKE